MHTHLRYFLLFPVLVALAACGQKDPTPAISFVGISTGSVVTDLEDLQFSERFPTSIRDVLGIVSFNEVANGTKVQATWFSPDDRRMPLGRHTIEVASGANVAKFSIARQQDWDPAPYMLDIRAFYGEGETMKTSSGQVHFYVGMTDEEIEAYKEEYSKWQVAERTKREQAELVRQAENAALEKVQELLQQPEAGIVFRHNIDTDELQKNEIIVVAPYDEEMMFDIGPTASGALFSVPGDDFAIANTDGEILFYATKDEDVTTLYNVFGSMGQKIESTEQLTLNIYEDSITLTWPSGAQTCTSTIIVKDTAMIESVRSCVTE